MGWPYEIRPLSKEEVLLRRQALDWYACVAHYSALAPAVVFLLYRIVRHLAARIGRGSASSSGKQARYTAVPASPVAKAHQQTSSGKLDTRWRQVAWWLGDDLYFAGAHWGQRDEWLLAALWTAWLFLLSVAGTGTDYFHVTKRFGTIAVSQLPIQYLLSLKNLNPYAWVFRSSHEHVNRYHRVLGRIIYGLLLVHLVLYNAYFLVAGIWLKRVFEFVVLCGLLASLGFHALTATAVRSVRAYSYRLFFVVHVVVTLALPVLLFFHASSARLYLVESLVVFLVDLAVRRITTINAASTLETVPGTDLVRITSAVPSNRIADFRAVPGLHLYLSVPPSTRASAPSPSFYGLSIYDLLYNPFTVAAVDDKEDTVTFVARVRQGPMTKTLTALSSQSVTASRQFDLAIMGPYGTMASHFNDLLVWGPSKILLISGGVGATFTLPVYQALQAECGPAKVQLIWALRSAGDATWAVTNKTSSSSSSSSAGGKSVLDDPNIQLFLTGDMGVPRERNNTSNNEAGMEMSQLSSSSSSSSTSGDRRRQESRIAAVQNHKRPDIAKIVDDTFRHGLDDSVAILVCGPVEMTRQVRQRARSWVMKGRRVWWHGETFGW